MTSHRTRSNPWKIFSMMLLALALIQCGDKAHCDQLREEFYQYLFEEDGMTPEEKARMERLVAIVGGPAADGLDLLLSINNLNAVLTDHLAQPPVIGQGVDALKRGDTVVLQ